MPRKRVDDYDYQLGRIHEKLETIVSMHEQTQANIFQINESTDKNTTASALNTDYRKKHTKEHESYFGKMMGIIAVITTVMGILWNIAIAFIKAKMGMA